MKKQLKRTALISLLGLFLSTGHAATEDKLRQQLEEYFPELPFDEIKPAPMAGFHQISAGPLIAYMSDDGQYVLNGEMIQLTDGAPVNLTEAARSESRANLLGTIDPSSIITYSAKNEKHVITVFTDIDCGYCRKFHAEIGRLNELGISVRYLAFPRSGLNTESFDKAVSVWCAKDAKKALSKAKKGDTIAASTCDNPIQEQFELGLMLGVNATPTIMLEDGRVIPGYMKADDLAELIEQGR